MKEKHYARELNSGGHEFKPHKSENIYFIEQIVFISKLSATWEGDQNGEKANYYITVTLHVDKK